MGIRKRIPPTATLATTMEDLRRSREACVRVCAEAPIAGEHYLAADDVIRAVDKFAEVVTGERNHFHERLARPFRRAQAQG